MVHRDEATLGLAYRSESCFDAYFTKSGLMVFGFGPAGATKSLDLRGMPAWEPQPIASH
ncbi:MAG: hypothetical protein ACPF87_03630 [Flavobacteriales bacterium]